MIDPEAPSNVRLDQYVVDQLKNVSRSFVAKLIEQGKIKVNGKVADKSSSKIRVGDDVEIDYDSEAPLEYDLINIPILYEDDDCIVINKPAGILAHSKGAFNPEGTVASWLADKLIDMSGDRAGIVHRLDRGTSGVMICAKNEKAQKWLQKQFANRRVKKTYIAIVGGHLKNEEALIDMPIERNPKKPQTFRVGINGKGATTAYKVITTSSKYSLLELKPATGRTHQLRVHLNEVGHSIVGDILYGGPKGDRLYLHAKELELTLPSRERKVFEAELPKEFNKLIGN